jgi:hypothetical protein
MEDSPNVSSSHARYLPIYMGLAFVGTLALGLIIGFLTRPLIIPDRVEVVEVVPTAALSTGEAEASSTETQSAANTDDAPPTPTIMDFLMADARHIQGVEDAPVTIIEFSDFK